MHIHNEQVLKHEKGTEMKRIIISIIIVAVMLMAYSLQASDRWSIEFRAGVGFATQDFGDANLNTGYGFEGRITLHFISYLYRSLSRDISINSEITDVDLNYISAGLGVSYVF
jgi:hypothetical protein